MPRGSRNAGDARCRRQGSLTDVAVSISAAVEKYVIARSRSLICLLVISALTLTALSISARAETTQVPRDYQFDRCLDAQDILEFIEEARIEGLCNYLTTEDNIDAAVYIDDRLLGMTDEAFADQLAASWKLGKKTDGRWVVLAIFTEDRRMRLGCSENLDKKLTHDISLYIIEGKIAPKFKKSLYPKGIEDGLFAVHSAMTGKLRLPLSYRIRTYIGNLSERATENIYLIILALMMLLSSANRYYRRYYYGGYYWNDGYSGWDWFGGSGGNGGNGGGGGGGGNGGGGASGGW